MAGHVFALINEPCHICKQPYCQTCDQCVTPNCITGPHTQDDIDQVFSLEFMPKNIDKLRTYNFVKAKSQKIKGIRLLNGLNIKTKINIQTILYKSYVILEDSDLEIARDLIKPNQFARPCPITPRHGFVDSRPISTYAELESIWKETRASEEQGELLVCTYIDSAYNAVVTPSMITIGEGNDGATSGKNTIQLPVQGELTTKKERALACITDTEYLEFVYAKASGNYPFLTQLRDGPALPRAKDFIPQEILVKHIITVQGEDLLAWEKLIHSIEDKEHTVISHKGGSLGSHYGVHCKLNNVAYVTTFEPKVGDRLAAIKDENLISYLAVQQGLIYALSNDFDHYAYENYSEYMLLVLYCLHNYNLLGNSESWLLGFSTGMMIRLSFCASLGELRHFSGLKGEKKDRNTLYHQYFKDFHKACRKIKIARDIFDKGNWSSSYGGRKWCDCTTESINLYNAAVKFERRANKHNFIKLIEGLNKVVNVVHNGGKFLNKFVSEEQFTIAATNQATFAIVNAPGLYKIIKSVESEINRCNRAHSQRKQLRVKLTEKEKQIVENLLANQDDDDTEQRGRL